MLALQGNNQIQSDLQWKPLCVICLSPFSLHATKLIPPTQEPLNYCSFMCVCVFSSQQRVGWHPTKVLDQTPAKNVICLYAPCCSPLGPHICTLDRLPAVTSGLQQFRPRGDSEDLVVMSCPFVVCGCVMFERHEGFV